MSKRKIILKIIFVLFLLAGVFILQPKTLVFADAEVEEETVQEVEIDEIITEEPKKETVKESKEEVIEEEKEEAKEEVKEETIVEENTSNETQSELIVENQEQPQETTQEEPTSIEESIVEQNTQPAEKTVTKKVLTTQTKNESSNEIEVKTEAELREIASKLGENESKIVKLKNDITFSGDGYLKVSQGELTILGENCILRATILLTGTATLNLGKARYDKTLTCITARTDAGFADITDKAILNIYDEVTICQSSALGTAGGIQAHGMSTTNMYGGAIDNCHSNGAAGGVYLDQHATFNMYNGTIANCTGGSGGAIGLNGGNPLGSSGEGRATFNMYGGTISNCSDWYNGGGAINAYTSYPVTINIKGGIIKNCSATGTGRSAYGGGAVLLLNFADAFFQIDGGTIIGCDSTSSTYGYGGAVIIYTTGQNSNIKFTSGTITNNKGNIGGGIFLWKGNAIIANGFGLHNNIAVLAGDDIYNNANTVILGTVDTSAILDSCGHKIDGWYEDSNNRWSYAECTDKEDYYILFTHTGELYTEEYGLKAAHGKPAIEPDEPDEPIKPQPVLEPEPAPEPAPTSDPTPEVKPTPELTPVAPTKPTESKKDNTATKKQAITTATTETYTETRVISPLPTPKAAEPTIEESKTPLAKPQGTWALFNLILTIISCLIAIILLFIKKKSENDEYTDKEEKDICSMKRFKTFSVLFGIISIIIFIFTEDMTMSMVWIDKWTILMAIFTGIEIANIFIIRQKTQEEE